MSDTSVLQALVIVLSCICAVLALRWHDASVARERAEEHVLHLLDGATLTREDREHL